MNIRTLAQIVGGFVFVLGVGGLILGERQLANLMNIDLMLDLTRIALGAMLIGASFASEKTLRAAFAIFGVVYLANFMVAIISPDMLGMLPSRFGPIDNLLHAAGGLAAIAISLMPNYRSGGSLGRA
jgi:NADH:ubiquinone oxidoreductase subunit K